MHTTARSDGRGRSILAGLVATALGTAMVAFVPAPASAEAAPGTVTVSETTFNPSGSRTVTVTGTGFNDPSALGTRPPFAGKQAGAYVAFGKAADVWQPSREASSATRAFGGGAGDSSIQWAVQQEQYDFLDGEGAVLLDPDGTFTATITIDKDAADLTAASKPLAVNYGIYTYAGSGAKAARYETFTPITFAKYTSTPVVTAANKVYGKSVAVVVSVPAVKGVVATGDVVLKGAGTQTKKLSGGKATFTLPANLSPGKRNLSASFAGDANYVAANSAARSLTVTKDSVKITDKVTKKPTTKKSGKVRITVKATSSSTKPSGKVKVYFKKKGQKTVVTSTGSLKNGVKTLSVKKLKKKGTWKIYVKYTAGTGYSSVSSKYVGTVKVTK